MANLTGFNADNVEPMSEFDPIPAGKYAALITGSEMKDTKSGNGSYLELTFQVIEGEYKNRLLWARLNLDNPNELTVKIARAQLAAICRSVGVTEPKDSCELHNLPLVISVRQRTDDDGEVRNEIRGYSVRVGDNGKAAKSAGSVPPWMR